MKTTREAEAYVASMNERRRPHVPKWVKDVPEVRVYSLYWRPFTVYLGHMGAVTIPALDRNDAKQVKRGYGEPLVLPGVFTEMYDQMSGKLGLEMWDTLPTDEPEQPGVLRDVLGEKSGNTGCVAWTTDRRWFGIFAALGAGATKEERTQFELRGYWEPTKHELKLANEMLTKMMETLYSDAEDKAMRGPDGLKQIQPTEREAAEFLNLSPDWARKPTGRAQCPECTRPINPGTPVCFISQGGCGAVLDRAKVIRLQTPGYEHIWQAQATGNR